MKILSVDPGYDRVGIAVIERKTGEKEKLLYSDCFTTDKNRGLNERIFSVGSSTSEVVFFLFISVFMKG
jgi:Holliday junction resolvasome RuvABC endonuclease subunit